MELVFEELFDLPPEDIHTASPSGKFLVVVIYDIIDNKRRLKVSKILNGYGKRVQKSAFECIIDKKQYDALVEKLMTGAESFTATDPIDSFCGLFDARL